MNRREAFRFACATGLATLSVRSRATSLLPDARFSIGACDWSIGPAGSIQSFDVARQIGLDGVQVSLNTKNDELHLRNPDILKVHKAAAQQANVAFSGLAIGLLNEVPYKSEARTEAWVHDSIDVAQALGVRTVLLAFFSKNDLRNDPAGTQVVVERLKAVAPKAEKAGVVLGIESWLSARELLRILDAVGSPAIKIYYDVCNASVMGYDIFREIRELGHNRICEFHLKENGSLIGNGQVDLIKVRQALDDIAYAGWLQIEGAVPPGQPLLASYVANNQTVRAFFK